MSETNRPEFDPRRSAAMRDALGEEVARDGAATAPSRTRRTRTTVLVVLAVLVGLIASGTTAVALTGGALFGAPVPAATSIPPTAPATSTPTPTPSPTPTPTVPANPRAPVVRVPTACEALIPQAAAEQISGTVLQPDSGEVLPANPLSYTNLRVGSLACGWSDDPSTEWSPGKASVSLLVVPGATADDLLAEANREGTYIGSPEPELGGEVYSACSTPQSCGYIGRVGDYAMRFWTITPAPGESTSEDVSARFAAILTAIAALPAPDPVWQPDGPSLRGADSCDGLIDPSSLTAVAGTPMAPFKQYAHVGEYALSSFAASRQVSAFACSWTAESVDVEIGVSAAVLPGGASYFAESRATHPEITWTPVDGYPGEAHLAEDGTRLDVLVDSGWVEVRAPAEVLPAIAEVVLGNVGAFGWAGAMPPRRSADR